MTRVANMRGPLGLKEPKKAEKPRKRMRPVSAKKAAYRASAQGQEALTYMQDVKHLPCCICGAPAPSIAHHCIHGRYGTRRASDFDVIPLCAAHHDYPHPEAIHSGKETWAAKFGPDYGYIKQTRNRVNELRESIDF